ncbi:hypothetical protein HK099_006273 [Clydaea vesicula]|uniref:C2H2-type domain-containing protein n=1 Tax=Clydaea vesicula TaxID=447962 RepID=A0AAD5U6B0_9FUNG|nr:hypothetical protein HK099_006273 [Clydaea vesicula]KAJ3397096.1 hypothetical protein HDU92_000796 [Lobulomyces angularis]
MKNYKVFSKQINTELDCSNFKHIDSSLNSFDPVTSPFQLKNDFSLGSLNFLNLGIDSCSSTTGGSLLPALSNATAEQGAADNLVFDQFINYDCSMKLDAVVSTPAIGFSLPVSAALSSDEAACNTFNSPLSTTFTSEDSIFNSPLSTTFSAEDALNSPLSTISSISMDTDFGTAPVSSNQFFAPLNFETPCDPFEPKISLTFSQLNHLMTLCQQPLSQKNIVDGEQHILKPRVSNYKIKKIRSTVSNKRDGPKLESENKKSFVCPTCSKTFSRNWNLKTHLDTHIPKDKRNRPCICLHKGCEKRFIRSHDLVRHQITHRKSAILTI